METNREETMRHYEAWKKSGLPKPEYARSIGWDNEDLKRWTGRVGYYLKLEKPNRTKNIFTPVRVEKSQKTISITVAREGKVVQANGFSVEEARLILNS